MNKKIFAFLEIAAKTAQSKSDKRSFLLGAVAERKDGTIVKARNSPTIVPDRQAHSEFRLCKKLDYGATVYIARVKLDGSGSGMARPCADCMRALKAKKVKRVYFTIDPETYGFWDPRYDEITSYGRR